MPDNSENVIHQLFMELGVNIDYVPQNKNEMFTMGCQLICALFFIIWLLKLVYSVMKGMLKG